MDVWKGRIEEKVAELANPGSPGRVVIKLPCVCVCVCVEGWSLNCHVCVCVCVCVVLFL